MIRTVSVDLPGNTLDTIPDNNIYGPNRNIVQGINYADGVDGNAILLFISSILLIGLFTNFSYYEINYIIFLLGLILFPILIINLNLIKNYQFFLNHPHLE